MSTPRDETGLPVTREPLLPVERKLVAWSIGSGFALLLLLAWLTRIVLPAG